MRAISRHGRLDARLGVATRVLVLAGLGLLAFSGLLAGLPTGKTPPRGKHLRWIISEGAIAHLLAIPHSEKLVRKAFDNPRTWLMVGATPRTGFRTWRCQRVLSFKSYAEMKERLGDPAGIWGVLYDPEAWEFTPPEERKNVRAGRGLL